MDALHCDAIMHHMKNASVRDLRYRFSKIEGMLREGEEIEITKRKQAIARLVPLPSKESAKRPNFLERLHSIYGKKRLKISGAELIARDRGRE